MFRLIPVFDDLEEASDYVKRKCKTAPVECVIGLKRYNVCGDGYAEEIEEDAAMQNEQAGGV